MKIRKFKAANSHLGMRMIRDALGDDASILACYEVAGGVELIATADDLSAIVNSKGQPVDASANRAAEIASAITPADQIARRQENLRHLGMAIGDNAGSGKRIAGDGVSATISSAGSSADVLMRNTRQTASASSFVASVKEASNHAIEASKKAANALAGNRVKTVSPAPAAATPTANIAKPAAKPAVAKPTLVTKAIVPVEDSDKAQADILALKQELGSIRHWLENHLRQASVSSHADLPDELTQWADALGLDNQWLLAKPALLDAVKAGMPAPEAIAKSLAQGIHASALPERGVVFIIGPAGAGKTTLVNKLVMSDIRRHGHGGLTLVTTDGNRLGAQEQLRAAGRVLDVPVHSAFTPDDLRDTLARLSQERLVIIDTAGLQARNDASLKALMMQLACAPHAEVILALPSDADPRGLRALMSRCAGLPLASVALTRVDMSYALAPVLSLLSDYGLTLSAINQSPRMTDGIETANKDIEVLVAEAMVQADELINHSAGTAPKQAQSA
jgi:flagellar biosynthesis protein FlhF